MDDGTPIYGNLHMNNWLKWFKWFPNIGILNHLDQLLEYWRPAALIEVVSKAQHLEGLWKLDIPCRGDRQATGGWGLIFSPAKTNGGFLSHGGTPKSSILVGFSIIKTLQLLGYPIYGHPQIIPCQIISGPNAKKETT